MDYCPKKEKKKIVGTFFTGKELKILIFPLIIEQILAITVGMVDTMMISYAGEAAMSGVSLVDMINNLLINIFAAVATGGAVIISQYIGKKDSKRACQSAEQLITVTALISFVIALTILLFRRPLLQLLYGTIEPKVMENAMVYLMISAFSYPFLAVFNSCAAIYRSMGNAKISMKVSVAMNVFNAIGNAILIFGFQWGVAGAAISSLAARMFAAVWLLIMVHNKKNLVFITNAGLFSWKSNLVKKILFIALPNGIENGLFQLGRVLVVSIIALFGTTQIAANAVANNLDAMGCIAGQAMNLAMITVVGRCVGAGDYEQAVYYTKKLWKITYMITAAVNIVILSSLPLFLNLYTMSQETYALSRTLVLIHDGMAIFLWPTAFTLANALRASGDVKFTMVVAIFSMCAFRIFLSIVLGIWLDLGAVGVWIAMVIDWIFRAGMFAGRFYNGKWKKFRLV